jgi:hypothetical protein
MLIMTVTCILNFRFCICSHTIEYSISNIQHQIKNKNTIPCSFSNSCHIDVWYSIWMIAPNIQTADQKTGERMNEWTDWMEFITYTWRITELHNELHP